MNISYVDTKDLQGKKFLDIAEEPVLQSIQNRVARPSVRGALGSNTYSASWKFKGTFRKPVKERASSRSKMVAQGNVEINNYFKFAIQAELGTVERMTPTATMQTFEQS
jgi:hypothetical protein